MTRPISINADLADKIGNFFVACALSKNNGRPISLGIEPTFNVLRRALIDYIAFRSKLSISDVCNEVDLYLHDISERIADEFIAVSDVIAWANNFR